MKDMEDYDEQGDEEGMEEDKSENKKKKMKRTTDDEPIKKQQGMCIAIHLMGIKNK